jgi:transposase
MASKKPSSRSAFSRSSGRKAGRPLELKVKLKPLDRKKLKEMMSRGRESVRVVKRARVLQVMGEGKSAEKAAAAAGVSAHTARRVGKRYVAYGLQRALGEDPRPGKERIGKPRQEQEVVAMLCGPSPSGKARWTVRLAAEESVKRGIVPKADKETVRVVMSNHALKPWREKNVVYRGADAGVRGKDGGRPQPLREAAEP